MRMPPIAIGARSRPSPVAFAPLSGSFCFSRFVCVRLDRRPNSAHPAGAQVPVGHTWVSEREDSAPCHEPTPEPKTPAGLSEIAAADPRILSAEALGASRRAKGIFSRHLKEKTWSDFLRVKLLAKSEVSNRERRGGTCQARRGEPGWSRARCFSGASSALCGLSGSEKCGREALEAPTRTSAVQKIIQTPRERK